MPLLLKNVKKISNSIIKNKLEIKWLEENYN
jgi:hypothetical protein